VLWITLYKNLYRLRVASLVHICTRAVRVSAAAMSTFDDSIAEVKDDR
jgi:hypothetical protein